MQFRQHSIIIISNTLPKSIILPIWPSLSYKTVLHLKTLKIDWAKRSHVTKRINLVKDPKNTTISYPLIFTSDPCINGCCYQLNKSNGCLPLQLVLSHGFHYILCYRPHLSRTNYASHTFILSLSSQDILELITKLLVWTELSTSSKWCMRVILITEANPLNRGRLIYHSSIR